ncbi:ABC transporter permease [Paludibaculum fermentans]|uniref:ABC transporter permease n=1 Tax=Paludibaculum fermentans TaxID=1473598 RepID=A0A7S7NTI1_PALFE|nr:ABC transporter permease [Paludibaculum fermentans]QOY89538.1 ABC transporter permease [Paludibaculum fermentans]
MNWIQQLFSRRQLDRDLAEEIRQHMEEKVEELMAGGLPRKDAELAARRAFGNPASLEEQGRDVWRWAAVEDFLTDVRFALRQLRKSPSFTLACILTLALGIGANTVVFSVVNAVVLRPLPFAQPERLAVVGAIDARRPEEISDFSYPNFFDLRKDNTVFEHLVSFRSTDATLTGSSRPVHVRAQIVSWDLFPLLGIQPALGRGFVRQEEESGQRAVVLSHEVWRDEFGGDPGIVGRSVTVDSQPHTVVGIAPRDFAFPPGDRTVGVWLTLGRDADSSTITPITKQRGARLLSALARLKPGVSMRQARAQLDVVAASLARAYPDSNKNMAKTQVLPAASALAGEAKGPLFLLLGAVGLVLLIACANIANLLLSRTAERSREFALRAAIGAGQGRIVRQLITESLTLSVIGCGLGIAAAMWTAQFLLPLVGDAVPRIQETSIDGRVLGFSVALAILTTVLFGLAPAIRVAKSDFQAGLREGGRSVTDNSDGLRGALCVGQIALGLVLLSAASLLIASFVQLLRRDLGLQPERVLSFSVDLPGKAYPKPRQLSFHSELLDRLASLPGVEAAALAMPLPLTGSQMHIAFNIQERPARPSERPSSDMALVTPGYFKTIGAPLLQGRGFTERDDDSAPPVLVVNRAFADRFFPGEDAVGKWIQPGASTGPGDPKMRQIIGIVGNARQSMLKAAADPIYYFPYKQLPWCCASVVVRSAAAPGLLEPEIRRTVSALDKQLPVFDVVTLDTILTKGFAQARVPVYLLGGFAGIALLLTVVGLYGVLAYSVVRRTREFGVRIALGASRHEVLGLVLRRATRLVLTGIVLGLAGALAVGRLISQLLIGVSSTSPLLLTAACVVLALTAASAAYFPARRAASIDPVRALRAE